MAKALDKCSSLLDKYGGHAATAGLTIRAEKLSQLDCKLNELANEWLSTNQFNSIEPEIYLDFIDITPELCSKLAMLEPFGQGNPKPLFWLRGCEVIKSEFLYSGYKVLHLQKGEKIVKAVNWKINRDQKLPRFIDITYFLDYEKYLSNQSYQIPINHFKEIKF